MSYRLDAYKTRMNAAFDGAEARLDMAEDLARQTQELRVDGVALGGRVRVTVDGIGQMVDLRFGEIADLDGPQLSGAVLEAHGQAKRRLSFHVERVAHEVYGSDAAAAGIITNSYREQFGYEEEPAR